MPVYSSAHGFLFFRNPQTASHAIAEVLVDRLGAIELHAALSPEEQLRQRRLKHMPPAAVLELGLLSPEQYAAAVKVTGVRNPWDVMVSRYLKRANPVIPLDERPEWMARPGKDKLRASGERAASMTFPKWIKAEFGHKQRARGPELFVDAADMVIRFEALQADFDAFLRRIGIAEPIAVAPVNVSPQRETAEATKLPYAPFYDNESRAIVGRVFAATIERFGYAFE